MQIVYGVYYYCCNLNGLCFQIKPRLLILTNTEITKCPPAESSSKIINIKWQLVQFLQLNGAKCPPDAAWRLIRKDFYNSPHLQVQGKYL